MSELFTTSREDGRSDSAVIVAMVRDLPAGELVPYEKLGAALQVGTNREFDRQHIQYAVSRAYNRLLKETCRALVNIRGKGYKVAHASEHSPIARGKEDRARVQRAKGLLALRHVNENELDPNQRLLHEAHLMVTMSICEQVDAMEKRQRRSEKAIRDLKKRVDEQDKEKT